MSEQRGIKLIDELRANDTELNWFEFKKDNIEPETIGRLCSALSNSARIDKRDFAYLLWGIDDVTHKIVGTAFNPHRKKEGNQELQLWLAQRLKPSPVFNFKIINHPEGQVVILEIPAAVGSPVAFNNIAYIRIGSSTPKLLDYPERYNQLIEFLRPYAWEHGIAKSHLTSDDVISLLDTQCYFDLMKLPYPTTRDDVLDRFSKEGLIKYEEGTWTIFNLGVILFAKHLQDFSPTLARKAPRIIIYPGVDKLETQDEIFGERGYAVGFENLVELVHLTAPKNRFIEEITREEVKMFPKQALRELIANALIHQDFTITGTSVMIEMFSDRVEISNPGTPPISVDRFIDEYRSRNEILADLMRRLGICEEKGSGIDKVVKAAEMYQLPAPDFRVSELRTTAILFAHQDFSDMRKKDRVRACYQHCCLLYVSNQRMSNQTLRERFKLPEASATIVSAIISEAKDSGLIKPDDSEAKSTRYARYIPGWA